MFPSKDIWLCAVSAAMGAIIVAPDIRVTVKMWESSDEDTLSPTRA